MLLNSILDHLLCCIKFFRSEKSTHILELSYTMLIILVEYLVGNLLHCNRRVHPKSFLNNIVQISDLLTCFIECSILQYIH